MAFPSVTYTFSAGTAADPGQVNQNFSDIINGLADGTKSLSIAALTCASTATITGAATLSSTLGVSGNTTVGGTLGVTGNTTVGGTFGATGAGTVGGALGVGGNVTATNNSASCQLSLFGAGTAETHAHVLLKANGSSRGLGTYAHDADGDDEWYWGRPYGTSDAWRILRADTASHNANVADPTAATSLLHLTNAGNISVVATGGGGHDLRNISSTSGADQVLTLSRNDTNTTGDGYISFRSEASAGTVGTEIGAIYMVGTSLTLGARSDERLKQNIEDWPGSGTEIIDNVKIRSFEWKSKPGEKHVGLIAQELQKVLPGSVRTAEDGILQVETSSLTLYLVKAFQELNRKFEEYKSAHP